jgi:hypothetical protein
MDSVWNRRMDCSSVQFTFSTSPFLRHTVQWVSLTGARASVALTQQTRAVCAEVRPAATSPASGPMPTTRIHQATVFEGVWGCNPRYFTDSGDYSFFIVLSVLVCYGSSCSLPVIAPVAWQLVDWQVETNEFESQLKTLKDGGF